MPVPVPFEESVTRQWPTMELLESVGQREPALKALAGRGFHTLGPQTYRTARPKEALAWTIHQGDTAPQAARVIHTDFEQGFIKGEVVHFDDLMATGSVVATKAAGKVRMAARPGSWPAVCTQPSAPAPGTRAVSSPATEPY